MAQPSGAAPFTLLQALGRKLSTSPGTMSDLLPVPGFGVRSPGLVYLITGGSGFLGRHLLRLLLEKEEQLMLVRVFDQRPDPSLSDLGTGERPRLVVRELLLLPVGSVGLVSGFV